MISSFSKSGSRFSITISTTLPAGTNNMIFLGLARAFTNTFASVEAFTFWVSPPSAISALTFSESKSLPKAEKPLSATFKIKLRPMTPKPTNPKSYFFSISMSLFFRSWTLQIKNKRIYSNVSLT